MILEAMTPAQRKARLKQDTEQMVVRYLEDTGQQQAWIRPLDISRHFDLPRGAFRAVGSELLHPVRPHLYRVVQVRKDGLRRNEFLVERVVS
jgi:hypothetical protein